MRCICPYRPSRDANFGVRDPKGLEDLLAQLERTGKVEILERAGGTVHLRWDEINVSIFVLEKLAPHVEDRRLNIAARAKARNPIQADCRAALIVCGGGGPSPASAATRGLLLLAAYWAADGIEASSSPKFYVRRNNSWT